MRINAVVIERSVVSPSARHRLEIPGCVLWCKQLGTHYQDTQCGRSYAVATVLALSLTCFVILDQVISSHQTSVSVSVEWE